MNSAPSKSNLQSVLDTSDMQDVMERVNLSNAIFDAGQSIGLGIYPPTVVTSAGFKFSADEAAESKSTNVADNLHIPRRPEWSSETTAEELERSENASFLEWRRNLADIENTLATEQGLGGFQLTPFEKNLNVWRQLWRVVERSDVVVQIVDARNPLLFYCSDLYRYVVHEMKRGHVLLVNKADLLSREMLSSWIQYFADRHIDACFFSAFHASVEGKSDDSRILDAEQLIDKLHRYPHTAPITRSNQRLTVGMVGYPNVGKSSTINVLLESLRSRTVQAWQPVDAKADSSSSPAMSDDTCDFDNHADGTESSAPSLEFSEKRVAVSMTPGKTKHFQTLVLSDDVQLCDCPGLVFPNFSASKTELICAGVLSIDQLRGDPLGSVSLVARRIPAWIFEGVYGIRFAPQNPDDTKGTESTGKVFVRGDTLLEAHARARGFMSDHGKPDISRSARIILKDFVSGRISFTHPPPPSSEELGESGIGPDLIAKKGRILRAREEVASSAQIDTRSRVEGRLAAGSATSERAASATESKSNGYFADHDVSTESTARVRRGKKYTPKNFVRVERSFYPKW